VAKPVRIRIAFAAEHWRNAVGVGRINTAFPRVAEYSNPDGLWDSTTWWLNPTDNRIKIAIPVQGNRQYVILEYA
jgi:hypothetical protein